MLGRIRRTAVFELVFTVAIALGLALSVQALAVKPYRIPSGSMEPTLQIGDRVLVNRLFDRLGVGPKVGQIVVFHPPAGAGDEDRCGRPGEGPGAARPCSKAVAQRSSGEPFVKRVVGLGGDRLAIRDGHVYRNGVRERDAYARSCGGGPACTFRRTIVVPRGTVFLMGDNRGDSDDSRYWGPVPQSWLIGAVLARYWPPARVDTL